MTKNFFISSFICYIISLTIFIAVDSSRPYRKPLLIKSFIVFGEYPSFLALATDDIQLGYHRKCIRNVSLMEHVLLPLGLAKVHVHLPFLEKIDVLEKDEKALYEKGGFCKEMTT